MYFIRTEETVQDAKFALERKQSIRRWSHAGCNPWEHLAFALPEDEQIDILETLGYDDAEERLHEIIHDELFHEDRDDEIAEAANLTKLDTGGYAEFLDGLCALESFHDEPTPADCTATLDGELLPYLVCYEGEKIGVDPDCPEFDLFIPHRIAWTQSTDSTTKRWKETL